MAGMSSREKSNRARNFGRRHLPVIGETRTSEIHQKAMSDPRRDRQSAWNWVDLEIDALLSPAKAPRIKMISR